MSVSVITSVSRCQCYYARLSLPGVASLDQWKGLEQEEEQEVEEEEEEEEERQKGSLTRVSSLERSGHLNWPSRVRC